ncbi:MAG: DNA mismatch repair protein MutS [Deltaproteobacteria bacterium]|nr:DNA mismatch repair protein MutS [Deltaproteobacteria bacterium]
MNQPGIEPKTTSTPMMKQYLSIKREHPDSILFFRMGDFYEMFMDDAIIAAEILKIALTSREKNKEKAIPMCGIPYHAAEGYLTRLLKAGHKVAICEQVEDPRYARGLVKREVTRIVTPGTAMEESLLDAREPSYLASIYRTKEGVGLSLVDASTGDFRVAQWTGPDAVLRLNVVMAQFAPREVLFPEDSDTFEIAGDSHLTKVEGFRFYPEAGEETLKNFFGVHTLAGFGLDGLRLATGAAGAALWYLRDVYGDRLKHLRPIRVIRSEDRLVLDGNTLKNLEILSSQPHGLRQGSLLHLMDRTVTAQGARLLKEFIVRPLKNAEAINDRLDLVQELVENLLLRGSIRERLRKVSDLERIVSRAGSGIAVPRDLGALRRTLREIPGIRGLLAELDSDLGDRILRGLNEEPELLEFLQSSLADELPAGLRAGGIIRSGFNAELDEVRFMAKDGRKFISDLEKREKEITGITSLKVGFNRVFGYYIEVTHAHRDMVPDGYIRKQTLANAERFVTQELKEMEERILSADERMIALEKLLFEEICSRVMGSSVTLQDIARALASVDLYTSLAELAHTSGYARPEILDGDRTGRLSISDGRHPVLEKLETGESFVPNNAYLDRVDNRLLIITGPNMAGKSTFMRQVALIVIMAQMGSFVPAGEAFISPVDRIFTRVGASDILSRGLSTFMVEMVETAEILNSATPDSLVILDEIGRGTSTFDGISIAWAVAEYLLSGERNGCRTMFATHYHELTELALTSDGVRNYNVAIQEWGDRLVFLRRVQEGAADRSYGIQVARLAGLPDDVIDRSREILKNLEKTAIDTAGRPVLAAHDDGPEDPMVSPEDSGTQMPLFHGRGSELVRELREIDLEDMTPLEAMNLLAGMKKRHA